MEKQYGTINGHSKLPHPVYCNTDRTSQPQAGASEPRVGGTSTPISRVTWPPGSTSGLHGCQRCPAENDGGVIKYELTFKPLAKYFSKHSKWLQVAAKRLRA